MVRFQFKRGLRFFEGTRRWSLEKINAVGLLVFESQDSACERISVSTAEAYSAWQTGKWIIDVDSLGPGNDLVWHTTPGDLSSLPPKAKLTAEKRAKVLMEIKAHFQSIGSPVMCEPHTIIRIITTHSEKLGLKPIPHWSTVWRWWTRLARKGCVTSLADKASLPGRPLNPIQQAIFQEVADEVFLQDQKNPVKLVIEEIERRYISLNRGKSKEDMLQPPSRPTVYRWLKKLNYSVVSAARNGKEFHRKERREVTGLLKVNRVLERYEIDHTPVDVLLVCETTWMVLGRPWLTLVIDRYSRMIAGFYISFHAPSASSVLYSLRQAILPKDELLKNIPGVKNDWPIRGCPESIAMDNGMDLHANAVEKFCLELLIEVHFMGAARPEMKGAIERLFGTLSRDLFHTLPGTVFNNIQARGDYPSEARAALTLKTFTEILVRWIVDVYHQTPHRGLKGYTPHAVWQKGEPNATFSLPAFPRQLDLMVGNTANRSIFHYGLEYDCIRYSSKQLLALRNAKMETPQVEIRVFEDDVGYIEVKNPENGEFLRVNAIDQDYACGLNRHVHALIRAEVRRRFNDEETRKQLLMVKAEIQAVVRAAVVNKKAGVRKRSAALRLVDSENKLGNRANDELTQASVPRQSIDEPEIKIHDLDEGKQPTFRRLVSGGSS
jgi:putative transposase